MNMRGIGSRLIRKIMKKMNIISLKELIRSAMANGVEFVECNMSMEVMGIKKKS